MAMYKDLKLYTLPNSWPELRPTPNFYHLFLPKICITDYSYFILISLPYCSFQHHLNWIVADYSQYTLDYQ